jgi:hypothetical protein
VSRIADAVIAIIGDIDLVLGTEAPATASGWAAGCQAEGEDHHQGQGRRMGGVQDTHAAFATLRGHSSS